MDIRQEQLQIAILNTVPIIAEHEKETITTPNVITWGDYVITSDKDLCDNVIT
jgi:hypothetical protein